MIDLNAQPAEYCRQIERYLCQKNDGHLIRIVGPSFDLVSAWAERGVPLKVAFHGIDRYVARYYAKGPRRRPVRIDFCEADVLDVFDEWRRATGVSAGTDPDAASREPARRPSLRAHLQRALVRLSAARAGGVLDEAFDDLIDQLDRELDAARGARGDARQALLDRLEAVDAELLERVRARLDGPAGAALVREAEADLAAFRAAMAPDAYLRARDAAIARLLRERAGLPTIAYR